MAVALRSKTLANQADRARFHRRRTAALRRLEPSHIRSIRQRLYRIDDAVAVRTEAATVLAQVETMALAEHERLLVEDQPFEQGFREIFKRSVVIFAPQQFDALAEGQASSVRISITSHQVLYELKVSHELIDTWLANALDFLRTEAAPVIAAVGETRRADVQLVVRSVMGTAFDTRLGVPDTAKLLRKELRNLSKVRSLAIARTESIAASAFGTEQGALSAAQEFGLTLEAVWIAALDDRTRETHAAASGQRRAMSGFFSIGGNPAKYPADIILPPEERVNCRCAHSFEPAT